MLTRLRALSDLDRIALATALAFTVMGSAALAIWWHTTLAQWVWNGALPPDVWALGAITVAHLRQMRAHRVTQLAQFGGHSVAKAAHREAAAARRIMADLYKHQTGLHHPDAPREN